VVDFKASTQGTKGTLSIFFTDGEAKTLQSTHPTYAEVLTYLIATPVEEHDEDYVRELANPALRLGRALKAVDPRYDFDLYTLSYDGLPLSGALADLIKDRLTSGNADWERFAKFAARLEANPSYHAKQALFKFIEGKRLAILADGRFVGHKGVNKDGLSTYSGPNNFVNGVLYGKPGVATRVPHAVGTVISKRRGDVDDSPAACATGLHVGSHEYAKDFASVLLTVAVAPEDVVGGEMMGWKFRTSKYEVLGFNETGEDFVSDDYEIVDRSDVLGDAEKAFVVGAPLLSHEAVNFEFAEGEKAEFNSLSSAGRNLYLNLRNLLAKSHTLAFETALADHGTWEDFLAKQEAEREEARLQEIERQFEQEQADVAAAATLDEQALVEAAAEAEALQEDLPEDYGTPEHLASLATMDDKATASAALKADLLTTTIGHKPLARKWESAGVTESSVRRWRKANGVEVTAWTKVKDALS
jgi:hypothetical protein